MASATQDAVRELETQVEVVLAASRAMAGLIAESFEVLDESVSLPQFRVLAMVDDGVLDSMGDVAEALGVHPSNATRACDRLVDAGLLERFADERDRRRQRLRTTVAGRRAVRQVLQHRRRSIAAALAPMEPGRRRELASNLAELTAVIARPRHGTDLATDLGPKPS